MVNSSKSTTDYQNTNITSDLPSYERSDQDQNSGEKEVEERLKRYRSIQSIYEETRGLDEEEVFFISGEEPSSYELAIKEEKWRHAMKEEMEAIKKNLTWESSSCS